MSVVGAHWFKSSFSGTGANGECVEVAFLDGDVALRDTKDRSLAPHRYPTATWRAFLAGVRAGEFDAT